MYTTPGMWALQNHRKAQSPGKSGAALRAPGPAADPSPMMPAPCSWAVSSQERPAEGPPCSFPGSTVQRGWAGHLGATAALCPVPPAPTRPFWKTRPLISLITLCLESPSGALLAKGHLLGCLRAEPQERGTPYPKKPLIQTLWSRDTVLPGARGQRQDAPWASHKHAQLNGGT